MKKILLPISIITFAAINNESFASKIEPITLDFNKENNEIILRIQTQGNENIELKKGKKNEKTKTSNSKENNTSQLRTIAQCGFINTGMKALVKTLYPLQGLSQVIAWTGATVATVATTMRDYFPLLDEYVVPTQKISIIVGVFGGLAYAGCRYAVHSLENSLTNFDNTRRALANIKVNDDSVIKTENEIQIEMKEEKQENKKSID